MKLRRRIAALTGYVSGDLEVLLVRLVSNLSASGVLVLCAAIYSGFGIVLPLALGASRPTLIVLGAVGAVWAWGITLIWAWTRVEARDRRHLLEWTTDLRHLDAQEFEWLVGEVLRREGWKVEETGQHGAPDGNIDLRIRNGDEERLVQCKRWTSRKVSVKAVRELGGTLSREGLTGNLGSLITLSGFSPQAIEEASVIGIELVDGASLMQRVSNVRKAQPCPDCGSSMIFDRSSVGWWLRCSRYPHCMGKQDLGREPARAIELLLGT